MLGIIVIKVHESILNTHPHIAKFFIEEERNINTLTFGSDFKARWFCEKCFGFYLLSVRRRINSKNPCPYCSGRKILKGFNDLESQYPLLSKEIDKNFHNPSLIVYSKRQILHWVCSRCTYQWTSDLQKRIKRGDSCPVCSGVRLVIGYNDLKSFDSRLAKEILDINPLEVHKSSNKSFRWKCSDCSFIWRTTVSKRTNRGDSCPKCKGSAGEKELSSFFNNLGLEFSQYNRSVISPYEVDFYFSNLKIAIEYNGNYWHSDDFLLKSCGKTSLEYHALKFDLCKNNGVDLIFIWESDWVSRKDFVKIAITDFLLHREDNEILRKLEYND